MLICIFFLFYNKYFLERHKSYIMPISRLFGLSGKRWQEFNSIQTSKCFSYVIGTTYKRYAIHLIFGRVVLIELFRYAVEFVLFNRSEISYISMQVTQLWHFRVEWRCSLALIWEGWRIRIADQQMMMAAIFFSMKLAFLFKSKLVLPYEKQSLLKNYIFCASPDQIWLLPWELTPITFSWQP